MFSPRFSGSLDLVAETVESFGAQKRFFGGVFCCQEQAI
jgi:hypothetical protein